MSATLGRLSLPRVSDGPFAIRERTEDWSEIEAILASPAPSGEAPASRRRHGRATPVIVSSLVATAAFAGLLTAALWGLPSGCGSRTACVVPATQEAKVSPAPATPQHAAPALPSVSPQEHVADAETPPGTSAAPVVQGRSASEADEKADGTPQAEPTQGSANRGRPHRHRHW